MSKQSRARNDKRPNPSSKKLPVKFVSMSRLPSEGAKLRMSDGTEYAADSNGCLRNITGLAK